MIEHRPQRLGPEHVNGMFDASVISQMSFLVKTNTPMGLSRGFHKGRFVKMILCVLLVFDPCVKVCVL